MVAESLTYKKWMYDNIKRTIRRNLWSFWNKISFGRYRYNKKNPNCYTTLWFSSKKKEKE